MMMRMNEKKVHNGRYLLCYEISPVLLYIVEQEQQTRKDSGDQREEFLEDEKDTQI